MTYKDITGAGLARAGYVEYFDQTLQRHIHHKKHIFKNFIEFVQSDRVGKSDINGISEVKLQRTGAADLNITDNNYIKKFMYALNDLTNNMNNIMRYLYLSNGNSDRHTIDYKELSARFPIKMPKDKITFHLTNETSLVSFADSLQDNIIILNITDEIFINFLYSMNAISHKYMHSNNTISDVMKAVGYLKTNIENKYSIYTILHFRK